jgi:hypothetical protein
MVRPGLEIVIWGRGDRYLGGALVGLPVEVVAILKGEPEVGHSEQALPFLTMDDAGFPHVCLLCRAQLEVVDDRLYAVVTSRRTRQFLLARGRATLLLVSSGAAYYCKVSVMHSFDDGWALTVGCELEDCIVDRSSVPLLGVGYTPDAALEKAEDWPRCRQLIESLASRHQADAKTE